jgi:hypothetical protein
MQRSIRTSLGMLSDLPGDVQFALDGAGEGLGRGNFTFANWLQLGSLLAAVWNMPQLSLAPCGSLCHAAIASVQVSRAGLETQPHPSRIKRCRG